jgi:hypothetical protein
LVARRTRKASEYAKTSLYSRDLDRRTDGLWNQALNAGGESQQGSVINRNPVIGTWRLTQPSVGESQLQITEKSGKLEVQEIGLGGARGTTVSYADGLLVIHWDANQDLRGYWLLDLNEELTKGRGKTVFIRHMGFEPGEEQEIEGRKVRVVEGVTIERMGAADR